MSDEHSFTLQGASAEYRELGSKLRELARASSSLDRGEASRGSQQRSIGGLPTSMPKPPEKPARDRRNSRVDIMSDGRAFDVHYVAAVLKR